MLTEPQKKWIEALRSGKYKQGKGFLKYKNTYCCLGVACEIFKDELALEEIGVSVKSFDKNSSTCPEKVIKHLDLYSKTGCKNNFLTTLTTLNDNGMSFQEIANELETGAYFRTEKVG